MSSLRVGFFTECYKPIVNGVVASIDALRDGLGARGVEVTTVAPHFPRFVDDARDVVRIPSLPLPTATAYRLCVPYLSPDDRARVRGIDLVHAHSPFVTGWMAAPTPATSASRWSSPTTRAWTPTRTTRPSTAARPSAPWSS